MNTTVKLATVLVLPALLVLAALTVSPGCKKQQEPPPAAPTEEVAAAAQTIQTTCPVMGGKIDKQYYTEYKGKKVYFCCAQCKAKFEADPENYLAKLPQFNQ